MFVPVSICRPQDHNTPEKSCQTGVDEWMETSCVGAVTMKFIESVM
jgi:hypothetical protein